MRSLQVVLIAGLAALVLAIPAGANIIEGFTETVSPEAETNATEPYIAVDRSDGTIYVAWQASGTHVARSDDGGRSFVQTPIVSLFGNDAGEVVDRPMSAAVVAVREPRLQDQRRALQ